MYSYWRLDSLACIDIAFIFGTTTNDLPKIGNQYIILNLKENNNQNLYNTAPLLKAVKAILFFKSMLSSEKTNCVEMFVIIYVLFLLALCSICSN